MKLTDELLELLKKLPTGNVADNNPEGYVLDPSIRPIDPSLHLIGRAFTVECYPGDNLALHQGLNKAGKGDVIIFDCKGYTKGGHFGDMMANACMKRGIAGVIINGSCRDSEDIRALHFPVYAKAFCPAHTTKEHSAHIGTVLHIEDAIIHPGDLVFGDCDGVVIIPAEKEDEVIQKAIAKYNAEKEILKRIKNGEDTLTIYGFPKLDA